MPVGHRRRHATGRRRPWIVASGSFPLSRSALAFERPAALPLPAWRAAPLAPVHAYLGLPWASCIDKARRGGGAGAGCRHRRARRTGCGKAAVHGAHAGLSRARRGGMRRRTSSDAALQLVALRLGVFPVPGRRGAEHAAAVGVARGGGDPGGDRGGLGVAFNTRRRLALGKCGDHSAPRRGGGPVRATAADSGGGAGAAGGDAGGGAGGV